jgi:hypothetical protein
MGNGISEMIQNSDLYKRFLQERDEILKNKWYMSEREGKDVGFERALLDWVCHHRDKWIKRLTK